jgi:hypothetical protein
MGISRIVKPENVSQEDFDSLIRNAANEIIHAYEQWDGIAPDSIYTLAGKEVPVERSVAFYDVFEKVWEAIELSDMAEEEYTSLMDIYYDDDKDQFFALGLRDGKLLKMNIAIIEDDVMLGEFEELEMNNEMASQERSHFSVFRNKDGKARWLAIASVATLNRVHEIDSTQLYNSFITYAEITGKYPILNIYHLGDESRVGQADLLARDGYVYIASGTFDETKYAQSAYRTLQNEPGKWGNSIEFLSFVSEIESFRADNINFQARVHKTGINTGISILLEKDAASILTTHQDIKRGGITMNEELRAKLLELFEGDEANVSEFLEKVSGANDIAMTRISRSTEEVVLETVPEAEVVAEEVLVPETEVEVERETIEETVQEEEVQAEVETLEIELGENFVRELLGSEEFVEAFGNLFAQKLSEITERMNKLEAEQKVTRSQVAETQESVLETREWVEDVPAVTTKKRAVVSYRPRSEITTTDAEGHTLQRSYAELADETINNIFD